MHSMSQHQCLLYLVADKVRLGCKFVAKHAQNQSKQTMRGTFGQCSPLLFLHKKIESVLRNMAHATNERHDGKTYYSWVQCKWFASIFKHNKIIHVNQLCCYCFLNCIHFWAIPKFWLCVNVCACLLEIEQGLGEHLSPKRLWVNWTEPNLAKPHRTAPYQEQCMHKTACEMWIIN